MLRIFSLEAGFLSLDWADCYLCATFSIKNSPLLHEEEFLRLLVVKTCVRSKPSLLLFLRGSGTYIVGGKKVMKR